MKTIYKVAIGAGVIGLLVFAAKAGAKAISQWAGQISFNIVSFFPLVVRINNPTPIYAPVDSVALKAYFLVNGMYVPFASAQPTQAFTIQPDASTDVNVPLPNIDVNALKKLLPQSIDSVIKMASNADPLVDVKIEATITIGGIGFIEQATTKVYLKQLLKNVA